MKLTLGNQEIEITEEQAQKITDAVADIFISKDKADSWPQYGENYWTLSDTDSGVEKYKWLNERGDILNGMIGQVFCTEEEAQAHVRYLKALTRVKGSSTFVPDWNNSNQDKYCVYYDHPNEKLALDLHWEAQPIGTPVYYQTKESGKKAIKDHKEDFLILAGVK